LRVTGHTSSTLPTSATSTAAAAPRCRASGTATLKRRYPALPVLKPNESMIDEAVAEACKTAPTVRPIGLVASFAPTLASMPAEFPPDTALRTRLADGAMAALDAGDTAGHDAAVVRAAQALAAEGCAVIALAQFSMARARLAVEAALALPVLTTPESAVRRLRARMNRP
jgi:hypothetical protein